MADINNKGGIIIVILWMFKYMMVQLMKHTILSYAANYHMDLTIENQCLHVY